MALEMTSSAFEPDGMIPARFTCDGDDISPELSWTDPPEGTASFALICDDPDAPVGTWVHWVVYNIPPHTRKLPEALPATESFGDGLTQGINDFQRIGYGGPCPPGGTHRYYFRLYALSGKMDLRPGASKKALLASLENRVLGEAVVMGRYGR